MMRHCILARFQACHHRINRGGMYSIYIETAKKATHDKTTALGLSSGFEVFC